MQPYAGAHVSCQDCSRIWANTFATLKKRQCSTSSCLGMRLMPALVLAVLVVSAVSHDMRMPRHICRSHQMPATTCRSTTVMLQVVIMLRLAAFTSEWLVKKVTCPFVKTHRSEQRLHLGSAVPAECAKVCVMWQPGLHPATSQHCASCGCCPAKTCSTRGVGGWLSMWWISCCLH